MAQSNLPDGFPGTAAPRTRRPRAAAVADMTPAERRWRMLGGGVATIAMLALLLAAAPVWAQTDQAGDGRVQGEPPKPLGTMTVTTTTDRPGADASTDGRVPVGTRGPSPEDNLQLPGKVEQQRVIVQERSGDTCVADIVCVTTEARDDYASVVADLTAPLIVTAFVDIDAGNIPNAPERVQALLEGEGRHVLTRLGPIPQEYRLSTLLRARLGAVGAQPDGTVYDLPFGSEKPREVIWVGSAGTALQQGYVQWAAEPGTAVRAARGGVVGAVRTQTMQGGLAEYPAIFGNMIAIVHDDGTVGVYGRLDFRGVQVRVGQRVAAGDIIGTTGLTGYGPDPGMSFTLLTPVGPGQELQVWPVQFQTSDGVMTPTTGAEVSALR